MKYVIITFLICFSSLAVKGQTKVESIIFYGFSSFQKNIYNYPDTTTQTIKNWKILQPSIAVRFKTSKNRLYQAYIKNLEINKNDNIIIKKFGPQHNQITYGNKYNTSNIVFGLERQLIIKAISNKIFVPSLAIGLEPYFNSTNVKHYTTNQFPSSNTQFGMQVIVTPRIIIVSNKKYFLDIYTPIELLKTGVIIVDEFNPSVSSKVNEYNLFDADVRILPRAFGIGIGRKL